MSEFARVVREAIADIVAHGYDSEGRVTYWSEKIKRSAIAMMVPPDVMQRQIEGSLIMVYKRLVEREGLLKYHQGVSRYTIQKIKPQLRAELDRRIMASANLIKLNREQMVAKTLQRFQGWATSIPAGGSDTVMKSETAQQIKKSLASQTFEQRRVAIDQGQKLAAAINNIVATDGGALALIWHSHWRQPGYQYRKDHKERDLDVYAIRGAWAYEQGLAKPGEAGWYDRITSVGEEPFCRCYAQYLSSLRDLSGYGMLTAKGEKSLAEARKKIANL